MLNIQLMISNGSDTNDLRNIAQRVAQDVAQLFSYDLGWDTVAFSEWDYRRDNPSVVSPSQFAARSLSMVERSHCVLAILGPSVPDVTSKEIRKVFTRRQGGKPCELWLFLNPEQKTDAHRQFLKSIEDEFGEKIVYAPYNSALDFQALAFKTLTVYVIQRLTDRRPVSDVGGARR